MRSVVVATLMPILMAASVMPASAASSRHGRILAMLSAIESVPEPEEWRQLGAGAAAVLIAIAEDAEQPTFRRARALIALGHLDDPAAADALEDLVRNPASEASLRRHAMLGLTRGAPERALPYLGRALASDDVAMRQFAVKALSESASPEARTLLRQRLPHEARPFLAQQIEAALAATP